MNYDELNQILKTDHQPKHLYFAFVRQLRNEVDQHITRLYICLTNILGKDLTNVIFGLFVNERMQQLYQDELTIRRQIRRAVVPDVARVPVVGKIARTNLCALF